MDCYCYYCQVQYYSEMGCLPNSTEHRRPRAPDSFSLCRISVHFFTLKIRVRFNLLAAVDA